MHFFRRSVYISDLIPVLLENGLIIWVCNMSTVSCMIILILRYGKCRGWRYKCIDMIKACHKYMQYGRGTKCVVYCTFSNKGIVIKCQTVKVTSCVNNWWNRPDSECWHHVSKLFLIFETIKLIIVCAWQFLCQKSGHWFTHRRQHVRHFIYFLGKCTAF